MPPPYRHIIWDWNGTLLDDAWLCVSVMNSILAERGKAPLTPEHYSCIFGFPVIDYYRQLDFDDTIDPFEKISTEFVSRYEDRRGECQLREGTREVLNQCRELGLGQSIVSSSMQDYLNEAVDHFGLRKLFMDLRGLDNHHANGKTAIATAWMEEAGLAAGETLSIGDTIHDVEVAEAIGVDCVLIPSGHQNAERLSACKVPILASLAELPALVQEKKRA